MASKIITQIRNKAKKLHKTIILPEGNNPKIKKAANYIIKHKLADLMLIEDKKDVLEKGLTLLALDEADGLVAGVNHTSKELYKQAFKMIGVKNKFASSFFLMTKGSKSFIFSDCALNIAPDSRQLVKIAQHCVVSAKLLGIKPKVAFLSFSTKGSSNHELAKNVAKAAAIFKRANPNVPCDGELQVDAALIPNIAKKKSKVSKIKGDANVLIFPDLNSGNISYKLVQRLAGFEAIGPISQGMKKPVNDLSRGASVEDIINSVCITAIQASFK